MNQSSYISDMTAITSVKIASAPPQPEPIIWQLAIEQNNRTHLYTLYLSSADSGPEVIRKTKAFLERVVSVPRWKEILSFKHLVVENVLLTSVSHPRYPLSNQPFKANLLHYSSPTSTSRKVKVTLEKCFPLTVSQTLDYLISPTQQSWKNTNNLPKKEKEEESFC